MECIRGFGQLRWKTYRELDGGSEIRTDVVILIGCCFNTLSKDSSN